MQSRILILLTALLAGISIGCNSSSKEPPLAHQIEDERKRSNDLNSRLHELEDQRYRAEEEHAMMRDEQNQQLAELSLLQNEITRKKAIVDSLQAQEAQLKAELDKLLDGSE